MKILITLASLDIGGAETHVAELAGELYSRGYDVIVASDGGVYADQLQSIGIKHYKVPLARRSIKDMLLSRKMLKKIIRTEKPDLVHAHARIPAFIISTLKRCCDFVFVTTVHGAFDTSFLLKILSGWGDKTLAVSEDLKDYLLANYDVKEENIYTSINGISHIKFSPETDGSKIIEEFGLDKDSKKICYVSRLSQGICSVAYMLIDKIEEICKAEENTQLIIVGDGECYEELKEKAEAVNNRLKRCAVCLTGPRTDVNEILATATVCVGVSRAILEPMSMEKLCIIAGDPGYIGIFTPDKLQVAENCNFTCRGCESTDADVLKNDIIYLLNLDKDEKDKLTSFGGQVIREKYSISKMVDDNEKMYIDAMRELGHDVAILGYYGYDNCGDDALLRAILNDMFALRPYLSPTVLSYKPLKTIEKYGVPAINRFNIFALLSLFKKVKLFIAGGGSLIQDITSTKSLFYYLFVIYMAKKMHLPVMLYGNGIGPITKPFNRKLASKVLNMVDYITLRDNDSIALLNDMNVTKPTIKITADPALGLCVTDIGTGRAILKKYGLCENQKFFCVSVRKWKNMAGAVRDFALICENAYNTHGLVPVFIPMQYHKDIGISREICARLSCPFVLLDESLTEDEIMAVMSLSECALAVRLHMLIFGVLNGLAVLGVNYDPKVLSFVEFASLPLCLMNDDFDGKKSIAKAQEFFENRENIANALSEKLTDFKSSAKVNAKIAVELMDNER